MTHASLLWCWQVYTVGCYDLFHRGHENLFKALRDFGRFIVAGIHDDASYLALKVCVCVCLALSLSSKLPLLAVQPAPPPLPTLFSAPLSPASLPLSSLCVLGCLSALLAALCQGKAPIDNLEKRMRNVMPHVDMLFVIPSTDPTFFLQAAVSSQVPCMQQRHCIACCSDTCCLLCACAGRDNTECVLCARRGYAGLPRARLGGDGEAQCV